MVHLGERSQLWVYPSNKLIQVLFKVSAVGSAIDGLKGFAGCSYFEISFVTC